MRLCAESCNVIFALFVLLKFRYRLMYQVVNYLLFVLMEQFLHNMAMKRNTQHDVKKFRFKT